MKSRKTAYGECTDCIHTRTHAYTYARTYTHTHAHTHAHTLQIFAKFSLIQSRQTFGNVNNDDDADDVEGDGIGDDIYNDNDIVCQQYNELP